MQKYFPSWNHPMHALDGEQYLNEQAYYRTQEVDAEIAKLRETLKVTSQNNTLNQEDHETERDLFKAALRWVFESGAILSVHTVDGVRHPRVVNCGDLDSIEIPPPSSSR